MISVLTFSSCVPRTKVVYLQSKNEKKITPDNQVYSELSHYVTEYKIREGDVLNINIFSLNHDDYNFLDDNNSGVRTSLGYVVDDSGYVEIPIIGNVKLVDQTIEEAEYTLKKVLEAYVPLPTVVIKSMSYSFTMLGEVQSSGIYHTQDRRINIYEAIAMARDLTEFGDRSKIKLLRYSSKGQVKVYYINLLSQDILNSEAFQIMPNDMIVVPPLASKNFRRNIIPLTGFVLSTIGTLYILLYRRLNIL